MKVFQLIQKNYYIFLGFDSNQAFDLINRFNRKTVGCFIFAGLDIIFHLTYMSLSANSFMEYTEIIYIISGILFIGISFFGLVLKMKKLFELIDGIEKHINGKNKFIK